MDDNMGWLDDEERSAWVALVALLNLLPPAIDGQLRRSANLSLFEYSVLAVLSEAPRHTLPMSTLAGTANGSLSRLSHVASRLESRGYLDRSSLPDDGRVTVARLTRQGLAKVRDTAPGHVAYVRATVVDRLDRGDLAALHRIGLAILDQVDADAARTVRQAIERGSFTT